jgi:hypothetical protein
MSLLDFHSIYKNFCAIGFFNEADTLEYSSVLIYLDLQTGLYRGLSWHEAALIKWQLKARVNDGGSKATMAKEVTGWESLLRNFMLKSIICCKKIQWLFGLSWG